MVIPSRFLWLGKIFTLVLLVIGGFAIYPVTTLANTKDEVVVDSSKQVYSVFSYDEEGGELQQYTEYNLVNDKLKGEVKRMITYLTLTEGLRISTYKQYGVGGVVLWQDTYKYNSTGQPIVKESVNFITDIVTIYEYSADGNFSSLVQKSTTGTLLSETKFSYINGLQLVASLKSFDTKGQLVKTENNTFNATGKIIRVENIDHLANLKNIYTYSHTGFMLSVTQKDLSTDRLIKITTYGEIAGKKYTKGIKVYEAGLLIKEEVNNYNAEGFLSSRNFIDHLAKVKNTYFYDQQSRVLSFTQHDLNNSLIKEVKYIFLVKQNYPTEINFYNKGDLVKTNINDYDQAGGLFKLTSIDYTQSLKYIYYYNADGSLNHFEKYDLLANILLARMLFTVKNERNLLTERQDFDLNGKMISKTIYTYSDTGEPLTQTKTDHTTDEVVTGDYIDLIDDESLFIDEGIDDERDNNTGGGSGGGSTGGSGGGGGGSPIINNPPVIIDPINTPPDFSYPASVLGTENELTTFDIIVNDADFDDLEITLNNLPTGATYTSTYNEQSKDYRVRVSWTPNFDQAGSYTVGVLADDGTDAGLENINLTIANKNRDPTLGFITSLIPDGDPAPGWQFDAGSVSQIVFQSNIVEQDADPFTWQWFLNGQAVSSGVGSLQNITLNTTDLLNSTANELKLVVTDSYNAVVETVLGIEAIYADEVTVIYNDSTLGLVSPNTRFADYLPSASYLGLSGYQSQQALLLKGDAWTTSKIALTGSFKRYDFSKHSAIQFMIKEVSNPGLANRTLQFMSNTGGNSKVVNLASYAEVASDGWLKVTIPISALVETGGVGVNKVEYLSFGPFNPSAKYLILDNVVVLDKKGETVPPVVAIQGVNNGDHLTETVGINISASDNTGKVAKVELYQDNVLVFSTSTSVATFNWDTKKVVNGAHTLQAKAYDEVGNIGQSELLAVNISNEILPTEPSLGTVIYSDAILGLSSPGTRFADPLPSSSYPGLTGYQSQQALLLKGDAWTTSKLALAKPFNNYDFSKHNAIEFKIKEVSNPGLANRTLQFLSNAGNSKIVNLTSYSISDSDGWLKVSIPITALADGATGGVNKVQFLSFGPFNPSAKYLILDEVVAVDTEVVSQALLSTATSTTITITTPTIGQTIVGTTTVAIATSDDTAVNKVEIYEDGVLGGTDTTSPFTFEWGTRTETNGLHTLQAKAYDEAGNVATSTIVSININNPVAIVQPGSLPAGVSFTGVVGAVSVVGNHLTVNPTYYKPNLANAPFQFQLMSTTTTLSNIVLASSTPNVTTNMWPAKYYNSTTDGVDGFRWYPNPSLAGTYNLLFTTKNSAGQSINIPVKVTINKPTRVCVDQVGGVYIEACQLLQSLYSEGKASGNLGDFYDNRDSQHADYIKIPSSASKVELNSPTPEVGTTRPETLPLGNGTTGSPITNMYAPYAKGMVIGNASTGLKNCFMECDHMSFYYNSLQSKNPSMVDTLANTNYIFLAPALGTYKPALHRQDGYGDVFIANSASGIISSVGASGTELKLVKALFYALAAFKPEVKAKLLEEKMMASTLQMLLRRNIPGLTNADYLTAKAHPATFNQYTVVTNDMLKNIVLDAQSITLSNLPAKVTFDIVSSNTTTVGGKSENLITQSTFASFVHLGNEYKKIFVVRPKVKALSGQNINYQVVALSGKNIAITKLFNGDFRIEVPYQVNQPIYQGSDMYSSRVDIGIFADNGTFISAPAILSVINRDDEIRNYDNLGSLISKFTGIVNTHIGFTQEINTSNSFKSDIYDWEQALKSTLSSAENGLAKTLLRNALAKVENKQGNIIGLSNIENQFSTFLSSFLPTYNSYLANPVDLSLANKVRLALDTKGASNLEAVRYSMLGALNNIKDNPRLFFDHQSLLLPLLETPVISGGSGGSPTSWSAGTIGKSTTLTSSAKNISTTLVATKSTDSVNIVYTGSSAVSEASLNLRFGTNDSINLKKLYPTGLDFEISSTPSEDQTVITELILEVKGGSKYTSVKLGGITTSPKIWHIDLEQLYPVTLTSIDLIRFKLSGTKTGGVVNITLPGAGSSISSEDWINSLDNRSYYIKTLLNQVVTQSAGVAVNSDGSYTLNETLLTDYDQYLIKRLNIELMDSIIFPSFMSRFFKSVVNYVPSPLK